MTIKEFIDNQKLIESKATNAPWHSGITNLYSGSRLIGGQFIENSDEELVVESRNNYKNLLDALQVATEYLEKIHFGPGNSSEGWKFTWASSYSKESLTKIQTILTGETNGSK